MTERQEDQSEAQCLDRRESVAEVYHRLTAYAGDRHWLEPLDDERLRQDFVPMAADDRPPAFKEYPACLPRVQLPDPPASTAAAAELLNGAGGAGRRTSVNLNVLSAVLAQCAGVTRRVPHSEDYFRAASSAGNRHPLELYVCTRETGGVADGVWHYDPRGHTLTKIGPPPNGDVAALVVSGVPWRSCWKYAERGYRYLGWDCGTVAAQALLAAHAHDVSARLEAAFEDSSVVSLIGAQGNDELPLMIVPLGDGIPAVRPSGEAIAGYLGERFQRFDVVTSVHESGNLAGPEEVANWRGRNAAQRHISRGLATVPEGAGSDPFDVLVHKRRSARTFDPRAAIPLTAARWIADVAAAALPWDAGQLHDVRVVVQRVGDLGPASYHPVAGEWVRIGPSDRDLAYRTCVDQELGRDASALFFITPSPGPEVAPDARTYRAALLAAGVVIGKTGLAAAALGLGCSGLTFVDSLLPEAIGVPAALAVIGVGLR
jgi:hypothetical protein